MSDEPSLAQNWQLGPHLLAAVLCQDVIEGKDGSNSIIRIIDQITITASGPGVPKQIIRRTYNMHLFLLLKTGEQPGPCDVEIKIKKPDLQSGGGLKRTIHMEAPNYRGFAANIHLVLEIDQTGLWWVEVWINEVRRTQVPLSVIYLPQPS